MLMVGAVALVMLYVAAALVPTFKQRSFLYPAPASSQRRVPAGFDAISLKIEDGLHLTAAYRVGRAPLPTLVFFHGNGDSLQGGEAATRALAATGYGVMLVEYRGYGGNPGAPDEQGLYRDGRAALAWLREHGVAAEKLVLIGNSLGSGIATQLASEQPVAGLVLVSGFTSIADVAAPQFPWLPVRLMLLDQYDNLGKIAAVNAPVFILHGTADTLIPAAHARRLATRARQVRLDLVEGVGHELAYSPEAPARIMLAWRTAFERAITRTSGAMETKARWTRLQAA